MVEACEGLTGVNAEAVLDAAMRDIYDEIPESQLAQALVMAARTRIEEACSRDLHHPLHADNLIWHPQTAILAYTSGSLLVLEDLSTKNQTVLQGHEGYIACAAVSPDGAFIATGAGSPDMAVDDEEEVADGFVLRASIRVWSTGIPGL